MNTFYLVICINIFEYVIIYISFIMLINKKTMNKNLYFNNSNYIDDFLPAITLDIFKSCELCTFFLNLCLNAQIQILCPLLIKKCSI